MMIEWLTLHDWQTDWNKPSQEAVNKFPLLWSREHYDVDWENPRMRGNLYAWKVAQLGWVIKETK